MIVMFCMTHREFDVNRDAYGFALRPQYVQTYKEYAHIYKVYNILSGLLLSVVDRRIEEAHVMCISCY